MMHKYSLTFLALACVVAAPALVSAQDAKTPPKTEFTSDLGYVNVTGNTSVTTLNIGERLTHRINGWQLKQDFGAVYGRTEGVESSNLIRGSLRGDYTIASMWATYILGSYDRNRFAGIRSRFSEGVGVVAKLIATDIDQLDLEGGFQITQQTNLDRTENNFNSLRIASSWKHNFAARTSFFQAVEVLPNIDDSKDLRVNTETALTAPLSTRIGLKLAYLVRFDNQPPMNSEGTAQLRKSDRIFSSGIQITY